MPMSLYIRVQNSFWTHRKTIRLRAKLGDAALWIPPRLWSYAADNQPDGDFSDYSADELAMLIGYSSNASSMLQALQEAGFMDGMQIHDWQEHNAYHEKYADRAKKAAKKRWDDQKGKGQDKKGNDKKGKEASIPTSNACSINTETTPPNPQRGSADAPPLVLEIEKPKGSSQQPPKKADDEEWLNEIAANPAYAGINVRHELGKMQAWCSVNRKQPSRQRFINWLNRAERPIASLSKNQAYDAKSATAGKTREQVLDF